LRINDELVQSVARRWNGFSVKRILAVTEELPDYLRQQDKPLSSVAYEDIMGALRAIQGRRGVIPENVKPLSELVLSPESKDMISQITGRLDDPEYTESHGGTLPTGVLFSGPPGTGKTATAKALAHEVQWGFLPVTGAEMARNPKELEKVFAKAKEIRPCLIFIDEADELLKSRDYSSNTEATNKLLTLMDGINDRVRDVVWIAATNNPDMIDAALLRSGRFTEKVVFELPSADLLAKHIDQWLDTRKVIFGASMNSQEVAEVIGEQSIANSEGILQAALNRAISRRDMPVTVTRDDVVVAHRSIVGRPQI
jgi:transitional endoplasmic reticulum ATPase